MDEDEKRNLLTYHCHALTDSGREGRSICVDDAARAEGVLVLLGEVKEPVRVIRKQVHAIEVGVRQAKLSNEVGILVGVDSKGNRSHSGKGHETKSEKTMAKVFQLKQGRRREGAGVVEPGCSEAI